MKDKPKGILMFEEAEKKWIEEIKKQDEEDERNGFTRNIARFLGQFLK